ncbi:hypothetical protein ACFQ0B_34915 [Nonomuraea thailandensis]
MGADRAERLELPAVGCVTTIFWFLKTLPPPSGMSPVLASALALVSLFFFGASDDGSSAGGSTSASVVGEP